MQTYFLSEESEIPSCPFFFQSSKAFLATDLQRRQSQQSGPPSPEGKQDGLEEQCEKEERQADEGEKGEGCTCKSCKGKGLQYKRK